MDWSKRILLICVPIVLSFVRLTASQSSLVTSTARCFSFTWLGPRFNEDSVFMNATCSDATRMAGGVPCFEPLVVSRDGTWPDVEYIWTHHADEATCVSNNDVCATYTYFFNGVVENSTYMCTRAVDDMGAAITSGCFSQRNGSFVTRACFCVPTPGGMPCNEASFTSISVLTLAIAFLAVSTQCSLRLS